MAPMIDLVFLLLIFFLVAAKYRPQEDFLPLQLPTAAAQARTIVKPEPLVVHILTAEGGCRVQIAQLQSVRIEEDTIEADLTALLEKFAETLQAQKRTANDPVEIICAPQVKWDYLAKIYNVLCGAGLTDITFTMTE